MKLGATLANRVASLDLHCPAIRGEWNDRAYLVGAADQNFWLTHAIRRVPFAFARRQRAASRRDHSCERRWLGSSRTCSAN